MAEEDFSFDIAGGTTFGTADLTNCEREQIHLAGSIQPHGALLVLEGDEHTVRWASANTEAFLGLPLDAVSGAPLASLSPSTPAALHATDPASLRRLPHAVPFDVAGQTNLLAHAHLSPDGHLVLEVEKPGGDAVDRRLMATRIDDLMGLSALEPLFDETAALIRELSGYDRVMVYRFDEDGHGAVVAERKRDDLESFLGNHYPATDIPRIARALYLRNRTRTLVDVDYEPIPIVGDEPINPEALDLSLSQLRSMSPIHLQYLRNMGVSATLVASLVVEGELWGLIACHHYSPKLPSPTVRAACELVAEVASTRIVAIESAAQASIEFLVRRFEQRLVESIGRTGEWVNALTDRDETLLQCLDAGGAALVHDGSVHAMGDVPSTPDIREIVHWLEQQDFGTVFATHRLARESRFEHLAGNASGVLAARISRTPGEMMLWFRPEQVRMITWGGDPRKSTAVGNDPLELSPRRSFAAWHQLVERTSAPWSRANQAVGRAIGESIADVVLQFRSVHLLMANQRIAQAIRHLDGAVAPLFIADGTGGRVVANEAFRSLVDGAEVESTEELGRMFGDVPGLRDLVESGPLTPKAWRGKVELRPPDAPPRPVLLRADPIFDRVDERIGTVFLFIDLSGRQEVESARLRFRQAVAERRAHFRPLRDKADEDGSRLFDRVLDNASFAALEAVAGLDVESIPDTLRSIEVSLTRASDLLERLEGRHGGR